MPSTSTVQTPLWATARPVNNAAVKVAFMIQDGIQRIEDNVSERVLFLKSHNIAKKQRRHSEIYRWYARKVHSM
jgi:5'(3')-deoxyribonucleotidase